MSISRRQFKEKIVKLLGGKCVLCGYNKFIGALEVHHKSSKLKTMNLSDGYKHNWASVEKELKHCVLLCCRCHRELHALFED